MTDEGATFTDGIVNGRPVRTPVVIQEDGLTVAARGAVLCLILDPFPMDYVTRRLDSSHAAKLGRMSYGYTDLVGLTGIGMTTATVIRGWLKRHGFKLQDRRVRG